MTRQGKRSGEHLGVDGVLWALSGDPQAFWGVHHEHLGHHPFGYRTLREERQEHHRREGHEITLTWRCISTIRFVDELESAQVMIAFQLDRGEPATGA